MPSRDGRRTTGDGARKPRAVRRAPREISPEVAREVEEGVGPAAAERVRRRLSDAAEAFERERFLDAARVLRTLVREAAHVPAVRELAGLTSYRLGRWAEAARHLEAYRESTGSLERTPVLADCYRALGRFANVAELWEELRRASPPPDLLTEGRLVAAGALADQGRVAEAIALLEAGPVRARRKAQPHHLRLWYALADLRERAGDAPGARELFGRVVSADPDFADAPGRLRALG